MLSILCSLCVTIAGVGQLEKAAVQKSLTEWDAGTAFVGLREPEVRRRLGEPTARLPGVWTYWQPLGPGAHSFQLIRSITFKSGRVVSAPLTQRPVGCILVEPVKKQK